MTDATEPRWLNETEKEAWLGLIAIMNRAFPELERSLRANDLVGAQYHVLVQLSEAPDRTLRLAELAERANVSQSRLTHRLRKLVERGDVAICEAPDDRRAKNATLTPAGQRRLDALAPVHVEDVRRLIFDPLDDDEIEGLARAAGKIAAALCQHPEYLNPSS